MYYTCSSAEDKRLRYS